MARQGTWRRAALVVGMVVAGWLVSGCGGQTNVAHGGRFASWPTVRMIAFADQWASALPRFLDIADVPFSKTLAPGTIQFRYDPSPSTPYLIGEIKGTGLKPNFCYQLKLAGKPGTATGGVFPGEADMTTNGAILKNARWWSYSAETAQFNTTNPDVVLASSDYANGWVAGYCYFGYVITDENGNIKGYGGKDGLVPADSGGWVPISANRCYHITGRTGQEGKILQTGGGLITYNLVRGSYGYSTTVGTPNFQLWYEKEPDNALDFALPAGTHDVVLLITEESFHNNMGSGWTSGTDGGFWDTVWASDWTTNVSPKTGRAWTPTRGGRIQFTTGSTNAAPTATVLTPADGGTVQANSAVTVKVKAVASLALGVTVSIDGGSAQTATYNEASTCYELPWSTTGLTVGSSHTVLATATDTNGTMAAALSTVTVVGNQAPVASFGYTQSGKTCTFTSTSTDSDGTIVSSSWAFGDGGTATGTAASHTYASNGSYVVTLTVTDNNGAKGTASQTVTVNVANNVMTATVTTTWLGSAGRYQPYAEILVKANGAPLAGASVTGVFSGSFTSKSAANTTDASGKAFFYGPPSTKKIGALTFTVTKITKTGYTSAGLPVSDSY